MLRKKTTNLRIFPSARVYYYYIRYLYILDSIGISLNFYYFFTVFVSSVKRKENNCTVLSGSMLCCVRAFKYFNTKLIHATVLLNKHTLFKIKITYFLAKFGILILKSTQMNTFRLFEHSARSSVLENFQREGTL